MSWILLGLIAAVLAVACVPAGAATVSLTYVGTIPGQPGFKGVADSPPQDRYVVGVTDTAGEANRILVDGAGRVRDAAVPLTPGPGCAVVAEDGWVACTATTAPGITARYVLAIDTGGGDDVVSLVATPAASGDRPTVDLGDGDDRAEVAGGRWTVDGGAGADTLSTTAPDPWPLPYYDRGTAEDWHGTVWDGGRGADSADGPSVLVSYAGRSAGVTVTPGSGADDGEPGEGDRVGADVGGIIGGDGADELHSSGHIVLGGPGDDRLVGTEVDRPASVEADGEMQRSELLDGGDGDDVVSGGGGADQLQGGNGDDVVDGGPGDDVLDGGPGADHVSGGDGDDRTLAFSGSDGLVPDGAPDVWEGGAGTDTISLGRVVGPAVDVTLDGRADDGLAGEGDDVAGDWERVTIGNGRLVGGDGPDELTVSANGSVDGRGGDDVLSGGNTMVGGPGRDVLIVREHLIFHPVQGTRVDVGDGERDEVSCDARKRVLSLVHDALDRVHGCFSLTSVTAGVVAGTTTRDRATLLVSAYCYGHQRCRGTVTVRAGRAGPVVGRGRIDLRADPINPRFQERRVRLRRARGLPSACGTLRVTVRFVSPFDPREVRETSQAAGRCRWGRARAGAGAGAGCTAERWCATMAR